MVPRSSHQPRWAGASCLELLAGDGQRRRREGWQLARGRALSFGRAEVHVCPRRPGTPRVCPTAVSSRALLFLAVLNRSLGYRSLIANAALSPPENCGCGRFSLLNGPVPPPMPSPVGRWDIGRFVTAEPVSSPGVLDDPARRGATARYAGFPPLGWVRLGLVGFEFFGGELADRAGQALGLLGEVLGLVPALPLCFGGRSCRALTGVLRLGPDTHLSTLPGWLEGSICHNGAGVP